jgi:hypothetical protein
MLCILQIFLFSHFGLSEILVQDLLVADRSTCVVESPLSVVYAGYYCVIKNLIQSLRDASCSVLVLYMSFVFPVKLNEQPTTIIHQHTVDNIKGDSCIVYTAFRIKTITISQNAVTLMVESLARPTEEISHNFNLFKLRGTQPLRMFRIWYFHGLNILIIF